VDLGESSFVDEFFNGLQVGSSESDVRLDKSEHLLGGSIESDKDCIVDLTKSKELEDLFGSWINTIDTSDSNNNGNLGFRFTEESSTLFGNTSLFDQMTITSLIFIKIFFSSSEDDFSRLFSSSHGNLFGGFDVSVTFTFGCDHFAKSFRNWGTGGLLFTGIINNGCGLVL